MSAAVKKLEERMKAAGSLVCVGLDPEMADVRVQQVGD
jgi:hypothetical protein